MVMEVVQGSCSVDAEVVVTPLPLEDGTKLPPISVPVSVTNHCDIDGSHKLYFTPTTVRSVTQKSDECHQRR